MACTCLLDDEAKAQLRVSKAIEREMEQWKKEASKEFKLLLLGKKVEISPITQNSSDFLSSVYSASTSRIGLGVVPVCY